MGMIVTKSKLQVKYMRINGFARCEGYKLYITYCHCDCMTQPLV